MTRRELLATVGLAAVITPSVRISAAVQHVRASVDAFFDRFTADWIKADPNLQRATGYFRGTEATRLHRHFTPETTEWRRSRIARAREALTELAQFESGALSEDHRISAAVMRSQLEMIVAEEPHLDFTGSSGIPSIFPLNPLLGVNVNLVNALTVLHPLASDDDARTYLAALAQVRARMLEAMTESRRLTAAGILLPRFIIDATIAQMRQFIADPPSRNPLVSGFDGRLAALSAIPPRRRAQYSAAAESAVAKQVYPAWQNAIDFLESIAPRADDNGGLWRFKRGADAYAYYLRRFTSSELSADEIHALGISEVARLETEMDSLLRQLGHAQGSIADRINQLKDEQRYPVTDEGRTRLMADVNGFIRDAQTRAASLFERTPRAPVVAQPYPPFREATAAAGYTAPSRDGTRPGVFQIPLRPERMTQFGLRTLVYHETIPGHHFQIGLEQENDQLPQFRRLRVLDRGPSAMSEGWGLYAEALAAEMGWYEGDTEGLLGRLDAELFRAKRLVVDTGIHAKRWTRQQAIAYGLEASEIDRYVVFPGQACSYLLGERSILSMRTKARAALGPRFSMQGFHAVVLATGTVPLQVLEQQVDKHVGRV